MENVENNTPPEAPLSEIPGYFHIIPATVFYDEKLAAGAKLLFGLLSSYTRKEGYSWASNATLAGAMNVPESTLRNWLRQLKSRGYASVTIILNDRKEVSQRRIYLDYTAKTRDEVEPDKDKKDASKNKKQKGNAKGAGSSKSTPPCQQVDIPPCQQVDTPLSTGGHTPVNRLTGKYIKINREIEIEKGERGDTPDNVVPFPTAEDQPSPSSPINFSHVF